MTIDETTKYLEYGSDIEKNIFMLENSLTELRKNYNNLGHKRQINRPIVETFSMKEPVPPEKPSFTFLFASIPGAILFSVLAITGAIGLKPEKFVEWLSLPFALLIEATCVILAFQSIRISITGPKDNKDIYQKEYGEYLKQKSEYEQNKQRIETSNSKNEREYQLAIKNEEFRMRTETSQKLVLSKQIEQMENYLAECQNRRAQFYDSGIVHPIYQNLSAMTAIYTYFSTGRCNCLEGPDGAYNLYESEKHIDSIALKIDIVIQKLNVISNNQLLIEQAIQASNNMLSQIMDDNRRFSSQISSQYQQSEALLESKLNELQESSYLSNYYAKRSLQELDYLAYGEYLKGNMQPSPHSSIYKNYPV